MENSLLYHLPIDPMLLIVGFSVLSVVLLIAVIVCIVKMNKLYRRYDLFMRGKDAETLEDTLEDILEELKESQSRDRASKDAMKRLSKQVKDSFQKFGFVKYNAFKGMGGNLSFVIAMLDGNNTGFVLDVVHSRDTAITMRMEALPFPFISILLIIVITSGATIPNIYNL